MSTAATRDMNVKQVVPFFRISDVEHSIRFYMHGLGFTMKHRWLVDEKSALVLVGTGWRGFNAADVRQRQQQRYDSSSSAPEHWLAQVDIFVGFRRDNRDNTD